MKTYAHNTWLARVFKTYAHASMFACALHAKHIAAKCGARATKISMNRQTLNAPSGSARVASVHVRTTLACHLVD